MTEKEIRKLKRAELLEMLYYLKKENETLREENESLKQRLENTDGVISSESLEKIIDAVKTAAVDAIRGQSENDTAEINDSNDESGKETPDNPPESGK